MNKPKFLKIVGKGIWKKNQGNKLLFICIMLATLFFTFLYGTTNSVLQQVLTTKELLYGFFTDIYYDSVDYVEEIPYISKDELNDKVQQVFINTYGCFYTVYKEKLSENKHLNLGFADEDASKLANITVLEGHMPELDNEIALTKDILDYLHIKSIGDKVKINDTTFILSGIISPFGHMWPKGEEQIKNNISLVNGFITENRAKQFINNTQVHRQILITRQEDEIFDIGNGKDIFTNINSINFKQVGFYIPNEFFGLLFLVTILSIYMILHLKRSRVEQKLSVWFYLGLKTKQIKYLLLFEVCFILSIGAVVGILGGMIVTEVSLQFISHYLEQTVISAFDMKSICIFVISLLCGSFIVCYYESCFLVKRIISGENQRNKIPIGQKRKANLRKFSLVSFYLNYNKTIILSTAFIMAVGLALICYSIFYTNYFKRDIYDAPKGTIVQDYDYQFVSNLRTAPYIEGDSIFFTDNYEKLGATDSFIEKLQSLDFVTEVKAYKENNKMNVLLNVEDIDDYIDGSDFILDGKYDHKDITDWEQIKETFGYKDDEILVGLAMIGYPIKELEKLSDKVVEGSINIDKILRGEEVILRVSSYKLEHETVGEEYIQSISPIDYTNEEAINSSTFKVGDEIQLSGILTSENMNGKILSNQLNQFYRKDATVKIGAIIRSNDGLLPYTGALIKPFHILTTNEVLDKLEIPANYHIISVYTNEDTGNINTLQQLSSEVPNMILENWQEDVKMYKIYNVLIYLFTAVLMVIVIISVIAILSSQLLSSMKLRVHNYMLLRINGVSYNRILRLFIGQVLLSTLIGIITGSISSLLIIDRIGLRGFNFFKEEVLNHYFSYKILFAMNGFMIFLMVLAILPALLFYRKYKYNIMNTSHS